MYLTEEDLRKIEDYLKKRGMRDTDFPVSFPLTGEEVISIVQEGKNVKTLLKYLLASFRTSNFINVNDITKTDKSYTLEEAIDLIPKSARVEGCIITFIESNVDEWRLYQYLGKSINEWYDIEYWRDILKEMPNHFKGVYDNEDLLINTVKLPEVGDYAFVGNSLGESLVYKCRTRFNWSPTTEKATNYISVIIEGNVTVGPNGNWFNDGVDTGIPAQGPKGDKPYLRYNDSTGNIEYSFDNSNWDIIINKEEITGAAATITVGTVSTVSPSTPAKVTNSGNSHDAVFNFEIPKGETGATGPKGEVGNGLIIKGYKDNIEALPSGAAIGDAWLVGTDKPYSLYIWNGSEWKDNGEINQAQIVIDNNFGDSDTSAMSQRAVTKNIGLDKFDTFSSSETYEIGRIVNYNGNLYKFTVEHTGAWNEEDVTDANLKDDIYDKLSELENRIYQNPNANENTRLISKAIKELYIPYDGNDWVLAGVGRNSDKSSKRWVVVFYTKDLSKSISFSTDSNPEGTSGLSLFENSGAYLLIDWNELSDGYFKTSMTGDEYLIDEKCFDLNYSPTIQGFINNKEINVINSEIDTIKENISKLYLANDTKADFAISDKDENAILLVSDGNIETKKFNSRTTINKCADYLFLYLANEYLSSDLISEGWSYDENLKAISNNGNIGIDKPLIVNKEYAINDRYYLFDVSSENGIIYFGSYISEYRNTPQGQSLCSLDFNTGELKLYQCLSSSDSPDLKPTVVIQQTTIQSFNNLNKYRLYIGRANRKITVKVISLFDYSTLAELSAEYASGNNHAGYLYDRPRIFSENGEMYLYRIEVNCPKSDFCKIMIMGDSITEGTGVTSESEAYAYMIASLFEANKVKVSGRANGQIKGVLSRFESECRLLRPQYIFIMIGTNGGNTEDNLTELINKIYSINATPIIYHIPQKQDQENLKTNNTLIDTVAQKYNIRVIYADVATSINRDLNEGFDSSLFSDTVHPNVEGNIRIVNQTKMDVQFLFNEI